MNEEELASYVVRYCKHELSEEEYRFLQRWLEEKQENRQTFREWVRTYRQGRKVGCWDGIQEEQPGSKYPAVSLPRPGRDVAYGRNGGNKLQY